MPAPSEHILSAVPPPYDYRIPYGENPLQFGELRLPDGTGPYPVVVVIHGGFWRNRYSLDHVGHLAAAVTHGGYATWSLEFRRLGDEGGGFPGTFHDVAAGVRALGGLAAAYNLDLSRVIVIGHSAGGHLALWLLGCGRVAKDSPIFTGQPLHLRGAVSLAGVVDLRRAWELQLSRGVVGELLGGSPESVPERYAAASPIELLPLGARHVLLHGTEDPPVPYEISEGYFIASSAYNDEAQLVTLPGAGHFEVIDPQAAEFVQVMAAIDSLLA